MKPDKLNRLIRGNGRMQPWFLRNTSELYESAVRSYYERGSLDMAHSTHNRHTRLIPLKDNEGPVRKLKKAEPEPSYADEYPRNHRLQAKQAASNASNQLLPPRMQTSRQRSMSFSVGGRELAKAGSGARPYSAFGGSDLGDSSSISCSSGSGSSEPSHHRLVTEALPRCLRRSRAIARRERKRTGRRGIRINELDNGPKPDMDMGLFSGRSMSVPPPPTDLAIGSTLNTLMVGQMPPSRRHHMDAIEKTQLANSAFKTMGEGDTLMTVDEKLKRQISVVEHAGKGRGTSSELGHHLMAAANGSLRPSGNLLDVIRQPPLPRFRYHTLGERAKQFEYIQFADGPVSNNAFIRRPQTTGYRRRLHKGSSSSSSSSRTTIGWQENQHMQMQQQPHSSRNILHVNHMQRSRSLEGTRGRVQDSPLSQPEPGDEDEYGPRNTRGSSLDNSSLSSLTARRQQPAGQSSGMTASKWSENTEESLLSRSKPSGLRLSRQSAEPGPLPRINVTTSRPTDTELRRSTPQLTLNSGSHSDSKGTARDIDWRGSSTTKSQSQRSSVEASFRGATSSGVFAQDFKPYPAYNVAARITCPPVRLSQLQQQSLEMDAPDDDADLSRGKAKPKLLATLAKSKVNKNTTNRVSRSSHRSFFEEEEEDAPNKNQHKQQETPEESEQREPPVEQQKWRRGSRAITVPTSLHLKGTNQLLAASASQVSAYKRAFRTQQQLLTAEALQKQAQSLRKPSPRPKPSRSSESSSPGKQVLKAADLLPIQLPKLQGRQGPTLTVSRTSVRAAPKGNAGGKSVKVGSGKRVKGTTGSLVKAVAAPVTSSLTAGGMRTTTPTFKQKSRTTTTSVKGAVSGAVTATKTGARTSTEGGEPGSSWGGARIKHPSSALTLSVQQQHSRNGSGHGSGSGKGSTLLGFRRETASRAASSLLQRRDETDQAAATSSQTRRQHQWMQQKRQQQQQQQPQQQSPRRQFDYQYPPWRPNY